MPAATDVVDTWVLPGSGGTVYCDLHGDGGLFTYGGLDPNKLRYVAISNLPENRYNFGPTISPGIFSYPGLFATGERDIFPARYFVKMHVYEYDGVIYDPEPPGPQGPPGAAGAQGPPGPAGPGLSQAQIDALHAAGQALGGV